MKNVQKLIETAAEALDLAARLNGDDNCKLTGALLIHRIKLNMISEQLDNVNVDYYVKTTGHVYHLYNRRDALELLCALERHGENGELIERRRVGGETYYIGGTL